MTKPEAYTEEELAEMAGLLDEWPGFYGEHALHPIKGLLTTLEQRDEALSLRDARIEEERSARVSAEQDAAIMANDLHAAKARIEELAAQKDEASVAVTRSDEALYEQLKRAEAAEAKVAELEKLAARMMDHLDDYNEWPDQDLANAVHSALPTPPQTESK